VVEIAHDERRQVVDIGTRQSCQQAVQPVGVEIRRQQRRQRAIGARAICIFIVRNLCRTVGPMAVTADVVVMLSYGVTPSYGPCFISNTENM
jgi:hypothetical protein